MLLCYDVSYAMRNNDSLHSHALYSTFFHFKLLSPTLLKCFKLYCAFDVECVMSFTFPLSALPHNQCHYILSYALSSS